MYYEMAPMEGITTIYIEERIFIILEELTVIIRLLFLPIRIR